MARWGVESHPKLLDARLNLVRALSMCGHKVAVYLVCLGRYKCTFFVLALLVSDNVTARRFAKVENQSEKSGGPSLENHLQARYRSTVARSTELSHM